VKEYSPQNFNWLIMNKIAGSARPNSVEELLWLKNHNIKAIATVMLFPLDRQLVHDLGFEYLFLQIPRVPTPLQIKVFINFVDLMLAQDKPVLIHCRNGLGRTGTMIALYLVGKGYTAEAAILRVKKFSPMAIEHYEQYNSIYRFAEYLRRKRFFPPFSWFK